MVVPRCQELSYGLRHKTLASGDYDSSGTHCADRVGGDLLLGCYGALGNARRTIGNNGGEMAARLQILMLVDLIKSQR